MSYAQADSAWHHHHHPSSGHTYSEGDSVQHQHDRSHRFSLGLAVNDLGQTFPGFESLNGHAFGSPFIDIFSASENYSKVTFTSGLTADCFLRKSFGLHAEAGYRYWHLTSHSDNGSDRTAWDYSQNIYYLQLGLKKVLARTRRCNLHVGLDLLLLQRTGMKSESNDVFYQGIMGGQGYLFTGDDAFAGGLNTSIGIDWRICHRLSLGVDITDAYLLTVVYGKETEVINYINSPRPTSYYYYSSNYRSTSFSPVSMAFHLSYRL
jgi:hypothetical protein